MKLRWSPEAAAEFAHLVRHIRKDNPSAATRVARVVVGGIAQLKKFPNLGRPGRVDGTRELVLPPLPFVVVYRIREDYVEIARVLHGAQRWP
jgi:toxin ParE1/3/4